VSELGPKEYEDPPPGTHHQPHKAAMPAAPPRLPLAPSRLDSMAEAKPPPPFPESLPRLKAEPLPLFPESPPISPFMPPAESPDSLVMLPVVFVMAICTGGEL